jgi:hypothetical protein
MRATAESIEVLADTRDELAREFKAAVAKIEATIAGLKDKGEKEAEKTYAFARERIAAVTSVDSDLPNAQPLRRVN